MTEETKNTKWVKGQSGNPNGRPKGSRNKSTPVDKLNKALNEGLSLEEYEQVGLALLDDDTISGAQKEKIFKTLIEMKYNLLQIEFKETEKDNKNKGKDNEEDDIPVFSTTAK